MNISQAERLIWKIQQALESDSPGPSTGKLAEEYTRLYHAAAQRLENCVAMIESGSELQALLLAESSPSLADLIALLSFKDSVKWREFCQKHNLASPDRLPERGVQLLNSLYAKQITPNHALYSQYRSASNLRQPERALEAMRLILKLNPGDNNARAEVGRLESAVLEIQIKTFQRALEKKNEAEAFSIAQKIEALGLADQTSAEFLPEIARLKARQALARGEEALQTGDWQLARTELDEIARTQEAHPFGLSSDDQERMGHLLQTVSKEEELFETERSFGLALQQVDRALADARELLESRTPDRSEMSVHASELSRAWRQLEQFARPVPDGLDVQCTKTLRSLRTGQESVRRSRRNALLAATALLLVGGLLAGGLLLTRRTIHDFVTALAKAEAARDVQGAHKLLTAIMERWNTNALPVSLEAAFVSTARFIAREEEQRALFQRQIAELTEASRSGFAAGSAELYSEDIKQAEALAPKLAPDFVAPAVEQLRPVQEAWAGHLSRKRQELNALFDSQLSAVEAAANQEFRYDRAEPISPEFGADLKKVVSLTNSAPGIEIRPDLLVRFVALRDRALHFQQNLEQWIDAKSALDKPSSAENHLRALRTVANSRFAPTDLASAARSALELDLSPGGLLGPLLLPGNAPAWQRFATNQELRLSPRSLLAPERLLLKKIQKDPFVFGVTAWRYAPKRPGGNAHSAHTIFLKGDFTVNKFARRTGEVYDPLISPNVLRFTPAEFDPPNDCLLEIIGTTPEAQLCRNSGLAEMLKQGEQVSISLLQVLDSVNNDTNSSPLFRAWVSILLHQTMSLQPLAWGLQWAPAAAGDYQQLVALRADDIHSGAWLNPELEAQQGPKLERFFGTVRKRSYVEQAKLHHELAVAAIQSELRFCGYARLDGTPQMKQKSSETLLYWSPEQQPSIGLSIQKAAPLTPIYAFHENRRELFLAACRALRISIEEYRPFLPAFYAGVL
jgi:hypothetical protein